MPLGSSAVEPEWNRDAVWGLPEKFDSHELANDQLRELARKARALEGKRVQDLASPKGHASARVSRAASAASFQCVVMTSSWRSITSLASPGVSTYLLAAARHVANWLNRWPVGAISIDWVASPPVLA